MAAVFIGFVSGIITTFGMGGGIILTILLGLSLGIQQTSAQATNLTFFIPTAVIATIINAKQKNIDYKIGLIIGIIGIIGAIVGANIALKVETNLRKYFAVFLFFIAISEIISYFKSKKQEKTKD